MCIVCKRKSEFSLILPMFVEFDYVCRQSHSAQTMFGCRWLIACFANTHSIEWNTSSFDRRIAICLSKNTNYFLVNFYFSCFRRRQTMSFSCNLFRPNDELMYELESGENWNCNAANINYANYDHAFVILLFCFIFFPGRLFLLLSIPHRIIYIIQIMRKFINDQRLDSHPTPANCIFCVHLRCCCSIGNCKCRH